MRHQIATFVVSFFWLLLAHQITSVVAISGSPHGQEDGKKIKPIHFRPANTENAFFKLQFNPEQGNHMEQVDLTPSPSRPIAQPDEAISPPSTAPGPISASKTTSTTSAEQEVAEGESVDNPFDHYYPILGKRAGSPDDTLEERRVCPVQPLPSSRGCTCPNQTLCQRGRNAPTCVKLKRDHENCGVCNNRCGLTQYCQAGKCHCQRPNFTVCGNACFNLRNNEQHCGACSNVCRNGKTCIQGTCKRA